MPASRKTVEKVCEVLERNVPDPIIRTRILDALAKIEGNQSFQETISTLLVVHAGRVALSGKGGLGLGR